MTVKAYVLMETLVGTTRDVARSLRQVDDVKAVDIVTGPFDIVALIEGHDMAQIGEIITSKIHAIAGIGRTTTCLVMKPV